ncbi:MAG: aminotransferase class V-fold PLP-dependent enzyme [Hyphomicrobiales bacterium]|nr:aminotransferase class V-fold PLP-dependent enzyme [Hyphomicrobiales bacterium]
MDAIGADWYVGNCHKWLCAPKGAAFIAIRDGLDHPVHPLAISHAYGEGVLPEFDFIGTRDPSAWLSIPAAIRLHQRLGGPELRLRNRELARHVAERMMTETGMRLVCPFEASHAMVALRWPIPVPGSRARAMHDALYDRHGFEAAVTTVANELCLRISVAAYNEASDFDGLGDALADVLDVTI